jgi:4-hydroxybenzoate polyprenyltransferase
MNHLMEKNNTLVSSFFTSFIRIKGVINWLAISFFGYLLGTSNLDITSNLPSFMFFLISTFFILAFTFAVNNYYDIDTDKQNPRRASLNALASGAISKQTGKIILLLFILIPVLLSLFITWMVFLFCVLLLLLMWMYSAPPLRLKSRPGLDILWHFTAFFGLILWGAYLAGSISHLSLLVAVSLGFYGCFAQIDNHIHDYPYDKASRSHTFAVWLGLPTAHKALNATFILYLLSLLPLLLLFPLPSYLTIVLITIGIIGSITIILLKKTTGPARLFHLMTILGGFVYLNCLLYQLNTIL